MTPRSLLAMKLFDFLESEGIAYVMVGDSRHFPHEIPGDLDIVVESNAIPEIPKILSSFCMIHQARIVQVLQHEQSACYYALAMSEQKPSVDFLHPDICGDFIRKGRLLLRAKDILTGRSRVAASGEGRFSFFVPDPAVAFIYYLIKKIDKGDFNELHGQYLSFLWQQNPDGAHHQLNRFWSRRERESLAYAAERTKWADIKIELPVLRKELRGRLPFSTKCYCSELLRIVRRAFNPTGLHIVFLGPDGSGKSTVLAKIEQDLAPAFRLTKRYHLRPFFGQPHISGIPNSDPQGSPSRNLFASLIKLGLWWLDFTVGYFMDVFPRLVSSTFVLFDRYYCDLSVDQKRYRYGGPCWLVTLIGKLIPRPNIVILLQAPADVILARKQEVSYEEVVRQCSAYTEIVEKFPNGYVVDSSQPLSEVVATVEEIILAYMSARTVKRLQLSGDNFGD